MSVLTPMAAAPDVRPSGRWSRTAAIARHEARLLRHNVEALVALLVMPLVTTALLRPVMRATLVFYGFKGASGAEHVVPGMAVMFGFIAVGFAAGSMLSEHEWGTWDRLRASEARPLEIVVGKSLPNLAVLVGQMTLLFAFGFGVLGLHVTGSVVALVVVGACTCLCLSALGLLFVSMARNAQQVYLFINVGSFVFAGLGGALLPLALFPGWLRPVAPVLPSYWSMRAFNDVLLRGRGPAAVALPACVLVGFALLFLLVAVRRFRVDEAKVV
jgi:ABC-2 type transport system permease protein